jgi:hypothetical protein
VPVFVPGEADADADGVAEGAAFVFDGLRNAITATVRPTSATTRAIATAASRRCR